MKWPNYGEDNSESGRDKMEIYRAVIVGLTGIGSNRPAEISDPVFGAMPASHASAYHRHPQTEVVGICDLRQEMLDGFVERWGDVWPHVNTYTDYREMFEKEQPDLISVVTPDHVHADITVAAAESSGQAILCEKPIATKLEDADRMIAVAEEQGVLLSIEHSRRWYPNYLKAREIIRSGEIGPLRTVVCEQFGPRAMMFRNGTHLIDLICFFADASPSWVVSDLEPGFEHFTEYKGDGGHDPATDPFASAYIYFDNGVRAFYNCRKMAFNGSKYSLTCENGRIEISDQQFAVITQREPRWWSHAEIPIDHYMYTKQSGAVAELIHVLENGGELVSPAREARKTLQVMLGVLDSHHAGNVRVDLGT